MAGRRVRIAPDDQAIAEASFIEGEGHGHGADPHHMAGEEDVLEGGDPGQDDVHQETDAHDDSRGGSDDGD